MKKIVFWFLLSGIFVLIQSCKKQSCPEPEPTKQDMLVQDAWQYEKYEVYLNGNLANTISYPGWERVFTPGGEYYTINDSHQATSDYGTYEFYFDDITNRDVLILTAYGTNSAVRYEVQTLSMDSLVYFREEHVGSDHLKYVYYHFRN